MAICVQKPVNISKQTQLLDGVDIGSPKWHVCGRCLDKFVHVGMMDISKVHLKTHSGNVNINAYTKFG